MESRCYSSIFRSLYRISKRNTKLLPLAHGGRQVGSVATLLEPISSFQCRWRFGSQSPDLYPSGGRISHRQIPLSLRLSRTLANSNAQCRAGAIPLSNLNSSLSFVTVLPLGRHP